jgi:uncharacterized protein (TIGR03790 family)
MAPNNQKCGKMAEPSAGSSTKSPGVGRRKLVPVADCNKPKSLNQSVLAGWIDGAASANGHLNCWRMGVYSTLRFPFLACVGILVLASCAELPARAGGSGLNTVVIINRNSADSSELGNYYCERRQVPPGNVLYIDWTGTNLSWSAGDFQTNLLDPLLSMLASRQLTNQIDDVALSMDIPFQTSNGSSVNSTTSALFYGLKSDGGLDLANSYAASEQVFRQAPPANAPGYSFLTCMITSDSLANAKHLVDQGVASDGTAPQEPVVLAKTSDATRNVRYQEFDNAIFDVRIGGRCSVMRTNSDSPLGQTNLFGYETGLANFGVSPGAFVPGAIADSMTSFGGIIFGPNTQTSLLAFINAGAAGSYGTVTEPRSNAQKFPNSQVYFYQSRGFSLAECYYQSLAVPYQGLMVAEPLAAPFAKPGFGQWIGLASNAVLRGTAPIALAFSAADASRPLQQVDLFVDGVYFRTLTNLPPMPGNVLSVALNDAMIHYTVLAGDTLSSIATGLAAAINVPSVTNATGVTAFAHGDRIELRAIPGAAPPAPTGLRIAPFPSGPPAGETRGFASSSPGSAAALSTFLTPGRNVFIPSQALPLKACGIFGTIQIGSWMRLTVTKTNGTLVTLAVTNESPAAVLSDLAGQIAAVVNASPALQGPDGIEVDDLVSQSASLASFNVYARATGLGPAGITVALDSSPGLSATPAGTAFLNDNFSNLQSRNHLYVTAGATNLTADFALDTTALSDGYHELTAVAYEGSSVRTQTRVSVPVVIQNSSLAATLDSPDLTNPAPVQGVYHIRVAANTNAIGSCTLFSTGGSLGMITNQADAVFSVNGASLGAGLHPFYAVVESVAGIRYRTETLWVRLGQ